MHRTIWLRLLGSFCLIWQLAGSMEGQGLPIVPGQLGRALPAEYYQVIMGWYYPGRNSLQPAQLDSTSSAYEQLLATDTLSDRMRVCVLTSYGQLLIKAKEYSRAFGYCKRANDLSVAALPPNDLVRGYAQASYGCYLAFYNVPELAIPPMEEALVGLDQLEPGDAFQYRKFRWVLFQNQLKLGLVKEALVHYEAYLAQISADRSPIRKSRVHNTYGFFLQKAGYHDEAMVEFERGLALLAGMEDEKSRIFRVNTLETQAHSLLAKGAFEAGIANLELAYLTRKELDLYDWAMQAMKYLIEYRVAAGQYQRAYQFYRREASYFSHRSTVTQRSYELYDQLGKLFDALGKPEKAATFYATYNTYVRRHVLPELEAKATPPKYLNEHIYLQYKAYEQELKIGQLENEQLRKDLTLRNYNLILAGLGLLLLGITMIVWRWAHRREEAAFKRAEADRRRILQLENENLKYSVANKEKDIKQLAADNRLRTKLKRDMLRKIEGVFSLPPHERDEQLRGLIRDLSPKVAERETISQLQDHVETINAEFEEKLRARIPNITAQEIRFCSLLRLGMENQQMAQLLNRSEGAIRTYKHRVKKKAGLTGKHDLFRLLQEL